MGEVEQRKLFVGGLSQNTTKESLEAYFMGFGELEECTVKFDNETQRSKCFGFVTFMTEKSVNEVLTNGPHDIDGKSIDPKKATKQKKFEQPRAKKVFVGGTGDISEQKMRDHFQQYGQIQEIVFPVVPDTQERRGFAFVEFVSEDSVVEAVGQEEQYVDNFKLQVKTATPRNRDGGRGGGRGGGGRGRGGGFGGGRGGGGYGGGGGYESGGYGGRSGGGGYGGSSGGYGGGGQSYGGGSDYSSGGGSYGSSGYSDTSSGGYGGGYGGSSGGGGYGDGGGYKSGGGGGSYGGGGYGKSPRGGGRGGGGGGGGGGGYHPYGRK